MKHPEKWRETIDPFSLDYKTFQPIEILGYPHAGNDVFHARGMFNGEEVNAYIKAARQKSEAIENEVKILSQLNTPLIPAVIDHGIGETQFLVTLELPGERLSAIVGENHNLRSLSYMTEYGSTLAKIHQINLHAESVRDRKFFHLPSDDLLQSLGLDELRDFFDHSPEESTCCFCHGDFHYANVLWKDGHISGILDFELAGIGKRDFDIAWALFLRPGQKFLKTEAEQDAFLQGYQQIAPCNRDAIKFYIAQCYVYFLRLEENDTEYCDYVRNWLKKIC